MTKLVNKTVNTHLVGTDRNAFALMGSFKKQARKDGWTLEEIKLVIDEAMKGDYDHLIQTLCSHTLDYGSENKETYIQDKNGKMIKCENHLIQEGRCINCGYELEKGKVTEAVPVPPVTSDLDYMIRKHLTNLITLSGSNITYMQSLLKGKNVLRPEMRKSLETQSEYLSGIEELKNDILVLIEKAKEEKALQILDTVDPIKDELEDFGKPWWEEDLTGRPILCKGESCVIIVDEGKTVLIESPVGRVRSGKFYPYQYRVLKGKIEMIESVGLKVKTNPDPLSYELQDVSQRVEPVEIQKEEVILKKMGYHEIGEKMAESGKILISELLSYMKVHYSGQYDLELAKSVAKDIKQSISY